MPLKSISEDLRFGSFSDNPPWQVDPSSMPWREGIEELRYRIAAKVPELIKPRRIPPLKRVMVVLWHIGKALIAWRLLDNHEDREASIAALARRLRIAFVHLGPTYIKLGQIISSGEGFFPRAVVEQFRLCLDRVPPEPFSAVRNEIESELGGSLADLFLAFDQYPLAAASIAQVHAAQLRTSEHVVVKVQRPGIARLIHDDLAVMSWVAPLLIGRIPIAGLANPPALVELFANTISEELDFRIEAENMLDIARALSISGQRTIFVPRPHPTLVTEHVMVMERLYGHPFDQATKVREAGVDTTATLRAGLISFLEGAAFEGVFHGDLHAGNLLVQPDGRVGLLDFGITGRLDPPRSAAFLQLIIAAIGNDLHMQIAALRDLGALPRDVDIDQVISDLGLDRPPLDPLSMTPEELISELQDVARSLMLIGARMPKELMLFVKNMIFLDSAVATLAPDIDILAEIESLATYFTNHHASRIMAGLGVSPQEIAVDRSAVLTSLGFSPDVTQLTYKDLMQRRDLIRKRFRRAHLSG